MKLESAMIIFVYLLTNGIPIYGWEAITVFAFTIRQKMIECGKSRDYLWEAQYTNYTVTIYYAVIIQNI